MGECDARRRSRYRIQQADRPGPTRLEMSYDYGIEGHSDHKVVPALRFNGFLLSLCRSSPRARLATDFNRHVAAPVYRTVTPRSSRP